MRDPNLINVEEIKQWDVSTEVNGKWVEARPLGYSSFFRRFKLAWKVFTGKYDALKWDSQ